MLTVYRKHTDVQRTWRDFGWVSPSEDPVIRAKWAFYKSLNTEEKPLSKVEERS